MPTVTLIIPSSSGGCALCADSWHSEPVTISRVFAHIPQETVLRDPIEILSSSETSLQFLMAAPQGDYPPQEGYGQQYDYGSPSSPVQQPAGLAPGATSHSHAGGRKKRAYAGEAFEFGHGANAAIGGQPLAGGSYGTPSQPQPLGYQQPVYGAEPSQVQPAVPGYAPPTAPGVAQITQQLGAMGVADVNQPAQAPRSSVPLNQLYPTDLISQPFNVAELDYPPPPIVLPPNVSFSYGLGASLRRCLLYLDKRFPIALCELPPEIRTIDP